MTDVALYGKEIWFRFETSSLFFYSKRKTTRLMLKAMSVRKKWLRHD